MITTLLAFGSVLGLLIFIHELGHFLAAKWAGIKVETFSLGFPPRMFGKKIGDTDYCISWIPLGGYVKMAGMIDESLDTELEGKPYEFMSKPIWKRVIVIAAGPFMNVLLAILFFAGLTFHYGLAEPVPVVKETMADMPAAEAGLQAGDRIISISGQDIQTWDELTAAIKSNPGVPLQIEWERGNEIMSADIVPKLEPSTNIGLIGIRPDASMRPAGIFESVGIGFALSWRITTEVGKTIGMLFQGKESVKKGLAGPIQIAQLAGKFAREGFAELINFTALISLQLGLLNILPIPVLDGGHLVFLGLESIMRRPVSVRLRVVVQQIGMALLLALMVFIIINDIQKLWQ